MKQPIEIEKPSSKIQSPLQIAPGKSKSQQFHVQRFHDLDGCKQVVPCFNKELIRTGPLYKNILQCLLWLMNLCLRREQVNMGAQIRRFLGHQLLHPQILRLLVLLKPIDFEAQSSLLQSRLQPQIKIPNACPVVCGEIFILGCRMQQFL